MENEKLFKLNEKQIDFLIRSFCSCYYKSLYIEEGTQDVFLNKEEYNRLKRLMFYEANNEF